MDLTSTIHWVDASERLPEDLKAVLVHGKTSPRVSPLYNDYSIAWRHKKNWYGGDCCQITHWAELPQSPESEGK